MKYSKPLLFGKKSNFQNKLDSILNNDLLLVRSMISPPRVIKCFGCPVKFNLVSVLSQSTGVLSREVVLVKEIQIDPIQMIRLSGKIIQIHLNLEEF